MNDIINTTALLLYHFTVLVYFTTWSWTFYNNVYWNMRVLKFGCKCIFVILTWPLLIGRPLSWCHSLRRGISNWTDKNEHVCHGLKVLRGSNDTDTTGWPQTWKKPFCCEFWNFEITEFAEKMCKFRQILNCNKTVWIKYVIQMHNISSFWQVLHYITMLFT